MLKKAKKSYVVNEEINIDMQLYEQIMPQQPHHSVDEINL